MDIIRSDSCLKNQFYCVPFIIDRTWQWLVKNELLEWEKILTILGEIYTEQLFTHRQLLYECLQLKLIKSNHYILHFSYRGRFL